MNVSLRQPKRLPSDEDVKSFEAKAGFRLPEGYRNFVLKWGAAAVSDNVFKVGADDESGVREFLPLQAILKERKYIAEIISPEIFPVASDDGGNYICLNFVTGHVLFCDLENAEEPPMLLTESFHEFLAILEPI